MKEVQVGSFWGCLDGECISYGLKRAEADDTSESLYRAGRKIMAMVEDGSNGVIALHLRATFARIRVGACVAITNELDRRGPYCHD